MLELGSGVGLTGITICRSCSPKRFVFSDCHPRVLQTLEDNVRLNAVTQREPLPVTVQELDWSTATEEQVALIEADTVIAAGQRSGSRGGMLIVKKRGNLHADVLIM